MGVATDPGIELLRESHRGFALLRVDGRTVAVQPLGGALSPAAVRAGAFRLALGAEDAVELEQVVATWSDAVAAIDRAAARFVAGDHAEAAALASEVHVRFPALFAALTTAPAPAQPVAEREIALAMLRWARGDAAAAFDHLRTCWRTAPRDASFETLMLQGAAAAARDLTAAGRGAEGSMLVATAIGELHANRCAIVRQDHAGHVLWRHPEVTRRVRGIVQVGAHEGGEIDAFCRLGFRHQIYFEPVPEPFAVLAARVAALDPARFTAQASPLAISDRIGTRRFFRGNHTHDSSFLDLDPARSPLHAANRHVGSFEVATTTLDELARRGVFDPAAHDLLFVDVQGAEHEVVLGARDVLRRVRFVCLEVSHAPVYAGAWTPERLHALMAAAGFERRDEMATPGSEQSDVLYARAR